MKQSIILTAFAVALLVAFTACRKEIPAGKSVTATGIVFDSVKKKVLPNAKIYLYGANQTFYGIYYSNGPLDSTISDNNGRFSINFTADGKYIDYGLQLKEYDYGNYVNFNSTNYTIDYRNRMFKFNYSTNVSNARVRGRELNYTQLHLKVLANPYDSIMVMTSALPHYTLLIGQTIDTTIVLRHLPNEENIIEYFTESPRDTVGLIPGRLYRRSLRDTIHPGLEETYNHSKTIPNCALMPRLY